MYMYVCMYVYICVQVCEAMEVLAQYNIIHRDLAARNVLAFSFHPSIRTHVLVKVRTSGVCTYVCLYTRNYYA